MLHKGTVYSSETLRPSALRCAKRRSELKGEVWLSVSQSGEYG